MSFNYLFKYNDYISNILQKFTMDNDIFQMSKEPKFNFLIKEGLIKTVNNKKTLEILKRRFPKFEIEILPDGEIEINNKEILISDINPLINNLGYFISNIEVDGEYQIYKNQKNANTITIEAKYDTEVNLDDVGELYHVSDEKYEKSILRNGLYPKSSNKLSSHPDRIYLTDSLDVVNLFKDYYNSQGFSYTVFKIEKEGVDKLFSDVNLRKNGYYTLNNIKPNYIKLYK
jgi:hypothetical protein